MKSFKSLFFLFLLLVLNIPANAGIKIIKQENSRVFWGSCSDQSTFSKTQLPYRSQFEITVVFLKMSAMVRVHIACDEQASQAYEIDLKPDGPSMLNKYFRYTFRFNLACNLEETVTYCILSCASGRCINNKVFDIRNCTQNCIGIFNGLVSTAKQKDKFFSDLVPDADYFSPGNLKIDPSSLVKPDIVIPYEKIAPFIKNQNWKDGQKFIINYHRELVEKKLIIPGTPESDVNYFLEINKVALPPEMFNQKLFTPLISTELKNNLNIKRN